MTTKGQCSTREQLRRPEHSILEIDLHSYLTYLGSLKINLVSTLPRLAVGGRRIEKAEGKRSFQEEQASMHSSR